MWPVCQQPRGHVELVRRRHNNILKGPSISKFRTEDQSSINIRGTVNVVFTILVAKRKEEALCVACTRTPLHLGCHVGIAASLQSEHALAYPPPSRSSECGRLPPEPANIDRSPVIGYSRCNSSARSFAIGHRQRQKA